MFDRRACDVGHECLLCRFVVGVIHLRLLAREQEFENVSWL